jgi:hypothetical protein
MSAADAASLSLWSALSLLGLILVVLGVLMEGAEAFIWTLSWLSRKRLSIIWSELPEPHVPRWTHRLDHVGWFILVIGLALETWGHVRVTDITGRENRRLTAQLDLTMQLAAESNERSRQLELTNARLAADNLVLRSNVAVLEAAVQWRTITPEQATNLIHLLSPVANSLPSGQKEVWVQAEGEDNPETQRYGARISEVLTNCGFEVTLSKATRTVSGEGLLINVKDRASPPAHAIPILNAFESLKTKSLRLEAHTSALDGAVFIWVLPKPEP